MPDDEAVKTATLDDLKKDSDLRKHSEPILVTEDGRAIGLFRPLPFPDESIPIEVRRELFAKAAEKIRQQLRENGFTEEQVERDIAALFEDDRS
jgi:hypothetical protein